MTLTPEMKNNIKSIIGMMKANPMQALQSGDLMKVLGGGDPKEVFYQKCKDMNINPDEILDLLK